jgi:aminoglycoside phosphotransferase family enzyme
MLQLQDELSCQDVESGDATLLARKVNFLSQPKSYTPAPETVLVRETHMSWVFMAGDRVYKLKKPVRFPYLDFSTLARRSAACQAEYCLNRRLAPDVYFGVVPLAATPGGFVIGGSGPVTDWLVVMRRLDEAQTLETALRNRSVSQLHLNHLTERFSLFYTHAQRAMISPDGYLLSLQKCALADRQVILNPKFTLPQGTIERLIRIQHRFLRQRREVLKARVHHRFIVDGHGDLRPEHIWLNPPFPVIDCLEFDARLRKSDALDEISFLHLECERLGGRWVGDALRRRLALVLDDDPDTGLFLFYRLSRAILRARLSIAHLSDAHPRTPDKWPRLARSYLALALADAVQLERLMTIPTALECREIKPDTNARPSTNARH